MPNLIHSIQATNLIQIHYVLKAMIHATHTKPCKSVTHLSCTMS